jgi:AcrR family transcriptional regulator
MEPAKKRGNLREAAILEARGIIEDHGLEALSLREVSRRLGVSHQAPYKHYPSRDHLLAEVIARCFSDFATHLDASAPGASPHEALDQMGRAYLRYALDAPLSYRLMFGAQMPEPSEHPEMLIKARHCFDLLREAVSALDRSNVTPASIDADAMFIWSTIHGLASILQTRAIETLSLSNESIEDMISSTMAKIGVALQLDQA